MVKTHIMMGNNEIQGQSDHFLDGFFEVLIKSYGKMISIGWKMILKWAWMHGIKIVDFDGYLREVMKFN